MKMSSVILAVAVLASAIQAGSAGSAAMAAPGEERARPHDKPAVKLYAQAGQPAGAAPVTFGMVFKAGDVPKGKAIGVRSGGTPVAAQVDVKRHYDDGSVRFAVVSLIAPALDPAGTGLEFASVEATPDEAKSAEAAKKLLATDFDAVVAFTFPDGKSVSASARTMLQSAGDRADMWLSGPVANEWLLRGAPVDAEGKADPDLNVQFQVRAYKGTESVRVSVVVENCWDTWAGNIGYDVQVKLGKEAKAAFERKGVDHERLSRWRRVFWWPAPPVEVHVAHDAATLFATKALPNFDLSIKVPEQDLADMEARWTKCSGVLLGSGFLEKDMGTGGGRDEVNYYPVWTVRYLMTMDPRAKRAVLGNADLAGSWPIHARNSKTKRLMTIDERPEFWLDDRGEDRPAWKPDRKKITGNGMQLLPDCAHQPSLAYVPYLVTGDYYYLEEAAFWANYCLLSQWPEPRENAKGIIGDEIRGVAWALRNMADAAFIAPDGSPEIRYLDEKIHNNLARMAKEMYDRPEPNPLGFWRESPTTSSSNDWKDAPNPKWMLIPPWQNDFVTWSLHHLAELGYAEAAKPRDFQLRWRVALLTNPDTYDPKMCTFYRMVVGEMGPGQKVIFYDLKKLNKDNASIFPKMPNFRDYYDTARGAVVCGVDAGFPKAEEAIKALDAVVWEGKPLGAVRAQAWTETPKWSIVPRPKAEPGR